MISLLVCCHSSLPAHRLFRSTKQGRRRQSISRGETKAELLGLDNGVHPLFKCSKAFLDGLKAWKKESHEEHLSLLLWGDFFESEQSPNEPQYEAPSPFIDNFKS
ncbi:hypothetical protein LINPERHAP1_LOCUS7422 [Linum perenne]